MGHTQTQQVQGRRKTESWHMHVREFALTKNNQHHKHSMDVLTRGYPETYVNLCNGSIAYIIGILGGRGFMGESNNGLKKCFDEF